MARSPGPCLRRLQTQPVTLSGAGVSGKEQEAVGPAEAGGLELPELEDTHSLETNTGF